VPAAVLCWLPALVLFAFRLDPRPEIFSLCYLGCYLAVLWRVEARPRLAWLLPLVQVLWVNVQGLFVLGPVVLGIFVAAHAADTLVRRMAGLPPVEGRQRRWWLHVGGACAAVALACLVNPYFLDGAMFPFLLFPKVTAEGNPYKKYIDELMSARDFVKRSSLSIAGSNWFFLSFYFLQLLLPISFLYPALWRAWRGGEEAEPKKRAKGSVAPSRTAPGLAGLAVVVGLLAVHTLTLAGHGLPDWVPGLGKYAPLLFLLGGGAAAAYYRSRTWAALLAFGLGAVTAMWMAWLQTALFEGPGAGSLRLGLAVTGMVTGAAAAALVLRWGGSLFRLLLAAAFCYLALQALQNWSRFALVAGAVLAWNFAEWAGELRAAAGEQDKMRPAAWGLRLGLAALLGPWIAVLATDRYYVYTGEPRHFALREEPLQFAHEAAEFAGRPEMPRRALVYGLAQTGVYDFHNAPRCKPFLDGRLEMPDTRTFLTYVAIEDWLQVNDPRWEKAVADLGNPLVLLEHQGNYSAEAALLSHPRWRCVYYDALAAVFLPSEPDTEAVPTVDFAARHFSSPRSAPVPNLPGAAAREEKALYNLAAALPRTEEVHWSHTVPLLLCTLDRAGQALEEDSDRHHDVWALLGSCHRLLDPHQKARPPAATDPWRLERSIYWAQATWCYRRAVQAKADHASSWHFLFRVYGAREMVDAQLEAGKQWLRHDPKIPDKERAGLEKQLATLRRAVENVRLQDIPAASLPSVFRPLRQGEVPLGAYFPETAARLVEEAEQSHGPGWKWDLAEQVGALTMHLGRPADARRVWEQATDCPSKALRLCRLGSTYWVERDFAAARDFFEQARKADPKLAEAAWALAMLHTEQGDAEQARRACRQGLELSLNPEQRSDLEHLQALLGR
jgi:tetratricopeptide (TPR) repeat protein